MQSKRTPTAAPRARTQNRADATPGPAERATTLVCGCGWLTDATAEKAGAGIAAWTAHVRDGHAARPAAAPLRQGALDC